MVLPWQNDLSVFFTMEIRIYNPDPQQYADNVDERRTMFLKNISNLHFRIIGKNKH